MAPTFVRAFAHAAARVAGSRFAKPIARAALVGAGLVLLAFVGREGIPGALGASSSPAPSLAPTPARVPDPSPATTTSTPSPPGPAPPTIHASAATPEDPVILNTATSDDLRRLPGIGEKRAAAILVLRARLGRFHAIEDLLQVKGIGRATLKRLRPLVRLVPAPAPAVVPDAGPPTPNSR